ncbi:membrane-associated guanylate kinase, WW and PDZ domain-containing protein 3-like [Agelaius tricolor]|uniref:membrane-associated guanylate kinase, WW and PDZ domain-containing protein 3-like n=1 Tax=Agelaius tricolor TaxID=9191 RepID=UPI0039F23D96
MLLHNVFRIELSSLPIITFCVFNQIACHLLPGDWDSYNPASSNVIYEEQSPLLSSSSHSAFPSEVCYLAVPGEASTGVQLSEELEQAENTVPDKISTLTENLCERKPQSSPQRTKNRWECPSSPGFGITKGSSEARTRRGRSASPAKSGAAEGYPHMGFHSPRKGDPEKNNLSCKSDSSRSESKITGKGMKNSDKKESSHGNRGRSASPQRHRGKPGSTETVGRIQTSCSVEQLKGGNGKPEVTSKEIKQKTPGKTEGCSADQHYPLFSGNNLLFRDSRRNASEDDLLTKSSSGDTSSSRFKTSSLSNIPLLSMEKQKRVETQEALMLNRHHGERYMERHNETKDGTSQPEKNSPVRKILITPGPWRIPSGCKGTPAAGVPGKRV